MKSGPEQHRGMSVRQHETISIRPDRILWIEFEHTIPDGIDKWRERHGRAGMPGLRLLHGIDGKRANGVDRQLIEFCGAQTFRWSYCDIHDCLLDLCSRMFILSLPCRLHRSGN